MPRIPKKNVIPQMFDVRPVGVDGGVDWKKIRSVGASDAPEHGQPGDRMKNGFFKRRESWSGADRPMADADPDPEIVQEPASFYEEIERRGSEYRSEHSKTHLSDRIRGWRDVPVFRYVAFAALLIALVSGGMAGTKRILSIKGEVLGESSEGIELSSRALSSLGSAEFSISARDFREASDAFSSASESFGSIGGTLARATRFIPFLSGISSGHGLLEGAKHLSAAGAAMSEMLAVAESSGVGNHSFLPLLSEAEVLSSVALSEIVAAQEEFARVDPEDVPEEKRETFQLLREKLPVVAALLSAFRENGDLVRELLGENGPRAYLFLFQNNHELRATGGFIGSYGLLDVNRGRVRKFFIDGIFNPDGQLRENVVPPAPIQKVSAAWSLHDSNWYPDFPTSAEKAISFYEKTGGPTTDGVVTLTPTVIENLLRLTGPIDMPEYGVTIDAGNFMAAVQEEVEVNYDKERNEPKKILADLAPVLLDRIFQEKDPQKMLSFVGVLSKGLNERHILLYARNPDIEKLIDRAGWSGRMLPTSGDYASVVHSNLNGYKTDGVIEESIEHHASIQADGSVLDTIRIRRKHTGGNMSYDWWNRVNSDYLRVYVPLGSELLSVKGHTYEFPRPPIDYDRLGFSRDPDVEKEERGMVVHESGTRISEESGKTVFGNWVYVSPGESVTVEYVYKLPFRVASGSGGTASYSLLFQKQSGTKGSRLSSKVSFPERYFPVWSSEGFDRTPDGLASETTLATDAFYGVVFEKR